MKIKDTFADRAIIGIIILIAIFSALGVVKAVELLFKWF